jgi:UDP-galactopyranose mutase
MLFAPQLAQELEEKLLANYNRGAKIPILELKKNADKKLQFLADFIYEKVFLHYTAKQWGLKPEELDSAVTARVPIYIGEDDRYFNDTYQAVPKEGYTKLFENLLDHPNITLKLSTPYIFDPHEKRTLIYTGMIDALFDYKFGSLPYRSIDMQFETIEKKFYQETATINYPNDYNYTRITEFKYIHPSKSKNTTILKEFPQAYEKEKNIPYYPIFTNENQVKHESYAVHAKKFSNLILLGRLAEYRYYDMDDVVAKVLETIR